jgi:hypothetical protein
MVDVTIKKKPERPRDDDHLRKVNTPTSWFNRRINKVTDDAKWLADKSGIANFANNFRDFNKAQRKYTEDQGLGFFEKLRDNPYKRDIKRWAGNVGYGAIEGAGDLLEIGWRAPPAFLGFDTVPGDDGIMGKYWSDFKMPQYDPKWNLMGLDIPNPLYDEEQSNLFFDTIPNIERDLGLDDFQNLKNPNDIFNIENFQNHLRNYGLELGGLNNDERMKTYNKWMGDKYFSQFKDASDSRLMTSGGERYAVPNEFLKSLPYWDPYLNLDQDMMDTIVGDYVKDFTDFSKTTFKPIEQKFMENLYNQRDEMLMDKFGFDKDELLFAMTKGEANNLDLGVFEDLLRENTMPFMEDDFRFDYETEEAQKMYEENPFWSEGLAGFIGYGGALKGLKAAGKLDAGPLSTLYRNLYPGLSGTGGTGIPFFNFPSRRFTGSSWNPPGRGVWQSPALLYGAAARETGDE